MGTARWLSKRSGKIPHVFGETRWSRKCRVIIKAEVVRHPGARAKKESAVLADQPGSPRRLHKKVYCARDDIENRIKELHHGLEIDRNSRSRFLGNQFRVLLTAAAYVSMQELRGRATGTTLARAQVNTLRDRLLKLGARIQSCVRRIVAQLPYRDEWRRIACALGAAPA
jgi:hypothetical protein